jgi:hypothetical protein
VIAHQIDHLGARYWGSIDEAGNDPTRVHAAVDIVADMQQ